MKESFRNWTPKGTMKIVYKDHTGNKSIWTADQTLILSKSIEILRRYESQGIVLTSRQLYYQLVGGQFGITIPNAMEIYKRICTLLTDARYGGFIDWDAIDDKGRVPTKHIEFENLKERVELAVNNFRLPRWKDQHYYVELYCEKQAGGYTVMKTWTKKQAIIAHFVGFPA